MRENRNFFFFNPLVPRTLPLKCSELFREWMVRQGCEGKSELSLGAGLEYPRSLCGAAQVFLLVEGKVPGLPAADGQPHCAPLPESAGPSVLPWGTGACQRALSLSLLLFPTGHSNAKLPGFSSIFQLLGDRHG